MHKLLSVGLFLMHDVHFYFTSATVFSFGPSLALAIRHALVHSSPLPCVPSCHTRTRFSSPPPSTASCQSISAYALAILGLARHQHERFSSEAWCSSCRVPTPRNNLCGSCGFRVSTGLGYHLAENDCRNALRVYFFELIETVMEKNPSWDNFCAITDFVPFLLAEEGELREVRHVTTFRAIHWEPTVRQVLFERQKIGRRFG